MGKTLPLEIVLAGRWRSDNVFTDFYLKSLAFFSENLYGFNFSSAGRFQYKRPAAGGTLEGRSLVYPLLRLAEANLDVRVPYRLF